MKGAAARNTQPSCRSSRRQAQLHNNSLRKCTRLPPSQAADLAADCVAALKVGRTSSAAGNAIRLAVMRVTRRLGTRKVAAVLCRIAQIGCYCSLLERAPRLNNAGGGASSRAAAIDLAF